MRTGHYVKGTTTGHQPGCWVAVVVEPSLAQGMPEGYSAIPAKCGRVHVCATRRSAGKWSAERELSFDTAVEFWSWLERYAYAGRRTWVVAPVASDALTLLGFFSRVDRLGARFQGQTQVRHAADQMSRRNPAFVFSRLVMRGKPDIVEYTFNQRKYAWLSIAQYWPFELSRPTIPESPASSSSPSGRDTASLSTLTPMDRCRVICRTMLSLGNWWSGLSAGGFGRTIGACALSFLKSRLMPRSISTHTDTRAQKLERLACHGGRASSWFFGDVVAAGHVQAADLPPLPRECPWHLAETLYHVDVSSMYPWLMSQIETPTKLVSVTYTETVKGLSGLVKRYAVVANVRLDTPVPEYPYRMKDRVIYPTGQFSAVLCGAELERALADGVVTGVTAAVIYERGRPFQRAAEELLEMRADAKARGDEGWEVFTKLLANSVTGKLAQRSSTWVDRPKTFAEKDWGEWPSVDPLTGAPTRFRAIAGMVQELIRDKPSVGTLTACYAFITSAGRHHMRVIRESLPRRSVVSQDTDGLWVTADGLRCLEESRRLAQVAPGAMRLVESSSSSRWYSPKHYFAAGAWTLAGMCHPVARAGSLSFFDEWTSNLARSSSPRPPETIHLHTREVTLGLQLADGTVGDDGWQVPHHVGKFFRGGDAPVETPEEPRQPQLFDVA